MKRALVIFLILLLVGTSFAHEEVDPGVLPDSFLWGLDKAIDSLSLALTANNEEKAKKGISIAMERIAEMKAMISKNKIERSVKAKEATENTLLKIKESIAKVKETEDKENLDRTVEIESGLYEVEDELVDLKETEIKIKIKGDLSAEKLQQLETLISDLLGSSSDLGVEITNKKDKIKLKIKDADELEVELEKKYGLADKKKAKAEEEIKEAQENLGEIESGIKGVTPNDILALLTEAREKIANAEAALFDNKFGEAFGQANAAKNLIKNTEKQLEEKEDEGELKIEAEMKEGFTKVKVKINEDKLKFNLPTTNKDEIINEIAKELGLSPEDIAQLVEFDNEEQEKELKKLKKEDVPGEKPNFDKTDDDEGKEVDKKLETKNEKDSKGKSSEKSNYDGKGSSNAKSGKSESDEEDDLDDDSSGSGGGGY